MFKSRPAISALKGSSGKCLTRQKPTFVTVWLFDIFSVRGSSFCEWPDKPGRGWGSRGRWWGRAPRSEGRLQTAAPHCSCGSRWSGWPGRGLERRRLESNSRPSWSPSPRIESSHCRVCSSTREHEEIRKLEGTFKENLKGFVLFAWFTPIIIKEFKEENVSQHSSF